MATQINSGIPLVFGVKDRQPIVNIPGDALKVRVRLRARQVAKAFVKFHDRIEEWVIGYDGDKISTGRWQLKFKQAVNLL
jgi:hypothetical protein